MRYYETIFIINPEIKEEDIVIDKYLDILKKYKSKIDIVDKWGMRPLAYLIRKFNKGFYVKLNYTAPSDAILEIERNFKIDEHIIRYLTVKQKKTLSVDTKVEEKE